ncbi:ABC transporter ATP-binding protein [Bacillaceae bacterium SIJ1]|uniref:ABC transporter ATP-binding protein n=1 Tax=Litoribacterium kuwaitense TaxID=1398745 RepID=UPI0013EB1952|nr:ABC transporter ATP-binding protein [Litoribacterium kuwaitense]NGP45525.1 ABC transporter ATP-binding protein [Litoribacterium kuwaitense]
MLKRFKSHELYRLLSLLGSNKAFYFSMLFVARLTTLIQTLMFALILKSVFDAISGLDDAFFFNLIGFILFFFLIMVLDFYLYYLLALRTNQITGEIRLKLLAHLMDLPMQYYDSERSGEIISRLTNDIQSVESVFSSKIINLNSALTGGIFTVVAIIILDWRMGIYSVIIGCLFGLVNGLLAPKFRHVAEEHQQNLGKFTSTLTDMLSGIRTVKLFNLYGQQRQRLAKHNEDIYRLTIQQGKLAGTLDGLNVVLTYLSTIGILMVGLLLSFQGHISIGTVVAILFLQSGVTSMFLYTGQFVAELQQSLVSTKRLFDILDIQPESHSYPSGRFEISSNDEKNMMIGLNDVTFSYRSQQPVLKQVSMSIRQEERAALVGPSGAGKSTIFKILMGFYPIDSGCITIKNQPIHTYTLRELRERIAYVPQDPILFHVTIEQNIRYGNLNATKEDVVEAAKQAHAHSFIERLPQGYDTVIGESATNLSGGQRQRIAIARAFIRGADILLLDEATSALDSQSEKIVQDALDRLMVGRTTLVIAHRLATIQNADTIYVMEQGQVVQTGTHEELLKAYGLYRELYQ